MCQNTAANPYLSSRVAPKAGSLRAVFSLKQANGGLPAGPEALQPLKPTLVLVSIPSGIIRVFRIS